MYIWPQNNAKDIELVPTWLSTCSNSAKKVSISIFVSQCFINSLLAVPHLHPIFHLGKIEGSMLWGYHFNIWSSIKIL